jgi:hypothetical protein
MCGARRVDFLPQTPVKPNNANSTQFVGPLRRRELLVEPRPARPRAAAAL